jgi:heme-degrading monooxygenase HmoA
MFVRNVTLKLNPDAIKDLPQVLTNEVLPILRKQNGFRDELICTSLDRTQVMALSFWDTKENFDAYARTARTDVLKAFGKLCNGNLTEETMELYLSTIQKLSASQTTAKA